MIGECLHNIQLLGGKAVSVTTDGYITNIKDLENEIITNPVCFGHRYLLESFRKIRTFLSGDETSLEIKNISTGIISWTTRGQLGVGSNLRATTGFQNYAHSQEYLIELFSKTLDFNNNNNNSKDLEYVQTSLRSAVDILKTGGHVTRKYKDQRFSLVFDNRREILDDELYLVTVDYNNNNDNNNNNNINNGNNDNDIFNNVNTQNMVNTDISSLILLNENNINDAETDNITVKSIDVNIVSSLYKSIVTESSKTHKENVENVENENENENENDKTKQNLRIHMLLDSKPLSNRVICFNLRAIASKFRVNEYNKRTSISSNKSYKNYSDTGIRNFIKGLLCTPPKYPGIASILNNYSLIIEFIKKYDSKYKINKSSLSKLKQRQMVIKQVPKTKETVLFVEYVKRRFPNFDETNFFKE